MRQLLFARTLAVLFLCSGEVTVIFLWAIDRIGRGDVRIVQRLQLLHVFVGRVVIPGGRNGGHSVAVLFLQDVKGDNQSGGAVAGELLTATPTNPSFL